MERDEYLRERRRIIEERQMEAWDHEDAGCPGDAEVAREWMRRELEALDSEYRGSR